MTRSSEIRRADERDAEAIAAILRGMGNENVGLDGTFDGNRVSGDYNLPAHSGMVFTI